MPEGIVKEFDLQKGRGLIAADDGEELPVHRNDLEDEALQGLYANDVVAFTIGRNRFGKRCAKQVKRIGWEEGSAEDDEPKEWSF